MHGTSGPVRAAIEESSFWMNRTRGGCGVTLGAGDLVLRETESCQCPGWYNGWNCRRETEMEGKPSPFWLTRWGRSVLARDLQEVVEMARMEVSPRYCRMTDADSAGPWEGDSASQVDKVRCHV